MRPLRTLFDRLASSSTSNDAGFSHFRRGIESSGLFGYHDLKQASDFQAVVELRTRQADELVRRVCAAREPHEMRLTVRRLDRLSDLLCSVVDTAELVRNVHPDREMASAANLAHVTLSNYLNRLNTHTGLYQALSKVFMNERLVSDMSHQERRVGRLLIKDFENSGIHMPDARRRRFVELNDKVLQLGQEFVTNSGPSVDYVKIKDPYSSLDGVSTRVIESLIPSSSTSSKSSKRHRPISSYAIIPIRHGVAYHILKSATNESVRERVFIGLNSGSIQQIQVLDEMLKTRGEIASLLGRKSYADLHLSDSMAKSPETVMSFLKSLSDAHRPKVMSDIELLQNLKRRHTKSLDATFKPWDKLFYGQYVAPQIGGNESLSGSSDPFHKNHHCSSSSSSEHDSQEMLIARHFTLGKTMEGLNRIFRSVYGITLEPGDVKNGEVWHSDVCKLNVVHETLGKIGIIYCDLFARNHDHGRKYDSPAHFTVRCSRRIDTDYEEQLVNHHNTMDFSSTSSSVPHDSYLLSIPSLLNPEAEIEVSDENNTATRFNKRYQIPIVVLVTGLNKSFDRPCYLTLSEVQTLFHEMGHAMHSMLARTDFQHIAGTRCALDFVEVPSILMEYFAKNPYILSSIASESSSTSIPAELFRTHLTNSSALESLETHHQIQLALLDQVYHSAASLEGFTGKPSSSFATSTDILCAVQSKLNIFEHVPGTSPQTHFTHLLTYGASYYSYFWSRKWAERLWTELFEKSLSSLDDRSNNYELLERLAHDDGQGGGWRRGGDLLKQELFGVGGGRDAWIGLETLGVVHEGEREGHRVGR